MARKEKGCCCHSRCSRSEKVPGKTRCRPLDVRPAVGLFGQVLGFQSQLETFNERSRLAPTESGYFLNRMQNYIIYIAKTECYVCARVKQHARKKKQWNIQHAKVKPAETLMDQNAHEQPKEMKNHGISLLCRGHQAVSIQSAA